MVLRPCHWILFTTYVAYVAVFTLTPFSFATDPALSVSGQLQRFEGLPSLAKLTLWDLSTNALFYAPLGYLVVKHPGMAKFSGRAKAWFVLVTSGVLSGSLELAQVFLPRHPSLADIVCNMAGAFLGGFVSNGRFGDRPVRLLKTMLGASWTLRFAIVIYLLLVLAAFTVPLPLSHDFTGWNSEFDLYLGNEWEGRLPWQGTILQVSLFQRELTAGEVYRNYLNGPSGDAAGTKNVDGLVFYHDFSNMGRPRRSAPAPYSLPVGFRVKDPDRIRWLTPHGLAVQNTSLILSAMPPIRPTGDTFFPHYEFSTEAWLTPIDGLRESMARVVSYSKEANHGMIRLAQHKLEIAFDLLDPDKGADGADRKSAGQKSDPPADHVMVTYKDGVLRLYTNGTAHKRELRQLRNALSDTVFEVIGQHFKWPLCAVLMFVLGTLVSLYQVSRPSSAVCWKLSVSALLPATLIEGIRILTVKAPADPFFVLVASGGVLSAVAVASSIESIIWTRCEVSSRLSSAGFGPDTLNPDT